MRPAILESPVLAGVATAAMTAFTVLGSRTARAPVNIELIKARSTSARSSIDLSPSSTRTTTRFERRPTSDIETTPVATNAAAAPAEVPSIADGYTLLVPVEIAMSGASGQPIATSLDVPSPPRAITAPTCSFQKRRAAAMVSKRVPLNGSSTRTMSPAIPSAAFSDSR